LLLTLVDGLIVFLLLEGLALWAWHRRTGQGLAPRDLLPNLLAGGALVLALRCALTPGLTLPALACLGAAGLGHAVDLRRRWAAVSALPPA
jgi:hypothetical protein